MWIIQPSLVPPPYHVGRHVWCPSIIRTQGYCRVTDARTGGACEDVLLLPAWSMCEGFRGH
jgi:hypothetical protein